MWFFRLWVPVAVAVTGLSLLTYAAVQQSYRQSLNDPQIQLAEDSAAALEAGDAPESVLWGSAPLQAATSSHAQVNIGQSLAPWIALYAQNGKPIDSTGELNDSLPSLPLGVFDSVAAGKGKDTGIAGEDRITWQPEEGVRQAVVIVAVKNQAGGVGFVVAGRSMREVEVREGSLTGVVLLAWVAVLIATFVAMLLGAVVTRSK